MPCEIEIMFFGNSKLIVIIIKAFFRNPHMLSSLLQSFPSSIRRIFMVLPPLLHKFDDLTDCSLTAPLLFVFRFRDAELLGVFFFEIGGKLDNNNIHFQQLPGNQAKRKGWVQSTYPHIFIFLRTENLETLFICVRELS